MILITLKTSLSLLLVMAVQSFFVQQSQEGCAARPQKDRIEQTLGKPVECPSEVKEGLCFRKDYSLIVLHLESSGRIESIFISDSCIGIHGLRELVDSLIQKGCRGEILPKPSIAKPGTLVFGSTSCERRYREEYECLTIDYSERVCQNCVPASVNIVWK